MLILQGQRADSRLYEPSQPAPRVSILSVALHPPRVLLSRAPPGRYVGCLHQTLSAILSLSVHIRL